MCEKKIQARQQQEKAKPVYRFIQCKFKITCIEYLL